MSSGHFEKPRWWVISDLVQSEIGKHGNRSAAIALVSKSLNITNDVVSRALKCSSYVSQHIGNSVVAASQTNIEMLMSLEQIDPIAAERYRAPVFDGTMTYAHIRATFDAIKADIRNGDLSSISLEQIKRQMFDFLPSLEGSGTAISPRVNPSWINSDMQVVMIDRESRVYEWACIISPMFSASSLRGRGKDSFVQSIAAASALCEGVGVMVGNHQEYQWLSGIIQFICRNSNVMLGIYQYGNPNTTHIYQNEGMAGLLGISLNMTRYQKY